MSMLGPYNLIAELFAFTLLNFQTNQNSNHQTNHCSMNFLPEVIAAVPAVYNTINELLPKTQSSSSPQQSNQGMSAPQPAIDSAVLHSALPVQPLAANPKRESSGLIIPFQTFLHRHKGDHKLISLEVASVPHVASQLQLAQIVEVIELEIVINPCQNAMKHGATIQVAWTPAYLAPDAYNVTSIYGAQEVTFGGSYHIGGFTIPCDLTSVNPIIKSPVSFNNGPRFTINCWLNKDATKESAFALADIFLRGKLKLSLPSLAIGTSLPA